MVPALCVRAASRPHHHHSAPERRAQVTAHPTVLSDTLVNRPHPSPGVCYALAMRQTLQFRRPVARAEGWEIGLPFGLTPNEGTTSQIIRQTRPGRRGAWGVVWGSRTGEVEDGHHPRDVLPPAARSRGLALAPGLPFTGRYQRCL